MPGITYKHAAQTSPEHERGAQTCGSAANDGGIEHVFVGRVRRRRGNHRRNYKEPLQARKTRIKTTEPTTETINEPIPPTRLEKNANITLNRALLR